MEIQHIVSEVKNERRMGGTNNCNTNLYNVLRNSPQLWLHTFEFGFNEKFQFSRRKKKILNSLNIFQ
ncbi:hypothetical protein BLA29_003944 [Euroglyphus maynei]|uniref:Uncharacterized protein n=1 Tax=Euroglyphus maynei TaxID=6958 RepID=A0A1Y3BVP8_EURMA|nr:hypothetical protein BLA29_003944 [Euroglyphus maynei]